MKNVVPRNRPRLVMRAFRSLGIAMQDHKNAFGTTSGARSNLAFPDSDHLVPRLPQLLRNAPIPLSVPCYLFLPIFSIAFRHVPASWTGVPEAAIHENGKPLAPKIEVRDTEHVSGMQIPPSDSVLDQRGAQSPLRRSVATRPNGLHVPAPDWVRD